MTTTLTKALEALKAKLSDQHGEEFSRVVELNARISQQDEQIIRELQYALDGHEQRRAEIHRLAITLANRVGALPPPAEAPRPIEADDFHAPRYLQPHPADAAIDEIHGARLQ